jgi:hypothetical protein
MPTLVKCLTYSNKISEMLMGAGQKTDFRINAPPKEVLQKTIQDYFVESYLETHPWMVTLKKGRDYISISEIDNSVRLHGNLDDFIACQDFSCAKRNHKLTQEESEKLAEGILTSLSIENYMGIMISQKWNAHIVYSHVLNSLGHDVSPKQVSEMMTAQMRKREEERIAEQMRRAQNWRDIGGKIIGAEG